VRRRSLTSGDIDPAKIAGRLLDRLSEGICGIRKNAKEAFLKASGIAHDAGRQVALTPVGCVLRRSLSRQFVDLMRGGTVDLIFGQ